MCEGREGTLRVERRVGKGCVAGLCSRCCTCAGQSYMDGGMWCVVLDPKCVLWQGEFGDGRVVMLVCFVLRLATPKLRPQGSNTILLGCLLVDRMPWEEGKFERTKRKRITSQPFTEQQ